ncbi:exported protein of unknown function [Nitrospira sp. KM1]|uniref:substrate-binding domain-containing protein n=1 Tax=Nitrospira sp. KM1 TaxID=1936990 RepID=UPI0013A749C3|nr:substrate-binding domain-containing protein [Nitrospira sp. KM1]BCA54911.1 exported protein of unknown function [Nitrospira sp. KM1]
MNGTTKMALACLGMVSLALAAESAQAATIVLNGTGSSAGRQYAGLAPVFICDASPVPTFFKDSANPPNETEWQCKTNGGADDLIVRYHALNSIAGYQLNQGAFPKQTSFINTAASTCAGATTVVIGGKNVNQRVCSTVVLANQNVHWGASDVQAASFHQTGGGATGIVAETGVSSNPVVSVPFSIIVGGNVRQFVSGSPQPLQSLTREQIEQIFAGAVTDWTTLGLAVSGGSSTIDLCLRSAGSGTKATADEVLFVNANETDFPSQPFNSGSGNMATCVSTHPSSIGYIDSDSVPGLTGGAYAVKIGGASAPSGTAASKLDLACGRYPFWANWNVVKRTTSLDTLTGVAGTQAKLDSLITNMVDNNPLPGFWVKLFSAATPESFVLKNQDRGPISYIGGGETACRQ